MEMKMGFNLDGDEEKAKRIKKKMTDFMGEIAEEMVSPEDIEKCYKTVTKMLAAAGCGTGIPYLKAFKEGMEFQMGATQSDIGMEAHMTMCAVLESKTKGMKEKVDKAVGGKA